MLTQPNLKNDNPGRRPAGRGSGPTLLIALVAICGFCGLAGQSSADENLTPGLHRGVAVSAATNLDWIFPIGNQSPSEPPGEWGWARGFDSTKQHYDLYVPVKADGPLPAILFISPSANPTGWSSCQEICERDGVLFACAYDAGNTVRTDMRIRIVMDVLDDLRRRFNVDVDRTYIAGFSGGARVATGIAFALPEYFGGVIPICGAAEMRDETCLRQRVAARLSVALMTGEKDYNRGEMELLHRPQLEAAGVRTRVFVGEDIGHAVPRASELTKAFEFIEAGLSERREAAEKFPSLRFPDDDKPLSRLQFAEAWLHEGQARMAQPETRYTGLMLLKGVYQRWPDLKPALTALKVLQKVEADDDRSWEAEDLAAQRKLLIAKARAVDSYASSELPAEYRARRPEMLKAAVQMWQAIVNDGQDQEAVAEGLKRLRELQKALGE